MSQRKWKTKEEGAEKEGGTKKSFERNRESSIEGHAELHKRISAEKEKPHGVVSVVTQHQLQHKSLHEVSESERMAAFVRVPLFCSSTKTANVFLVSFLLVDVLSLLTLVFYIGYVERRSVIQRVLFYC